MAYKVTDECVSCGSCASSCPVDAIAQGADHYEINPDVCAGCGSCKDACPMDAIVEE